MRALPRSRYNLRLRTDHAPDLDTFQACVACKHFGRACLIASVEPRSRWPVHDRAIHKYVNTRRACILRRSLDELMKQLDSVALSTREQCTVRR